MEKPKLIELLEIVYYTSGHTRYALFECPFCHAHFKTSVGSVQRGDTRSCGCLKKKNTGDRFRTHGMSHTKLNMVWSSMIKRCYNPNDERYKDYGGTGVTVCDEWRKSFQSFYDFAITHGYKEELYRKRNKWTIDRLDTLGNYTPDNCYFRTAFDNSQNTKLLGKKNKSGYRGVNKTKVNKKNQWTATIGWNGTTYHLGYFFTPELAAQAYNDFVIEHKTAHPLNIIPQ